MRKVRIEAGTPYDVLIGGGLLGQAGQLVGKTISPCRAVLVTDSNVASLYADMLEERLTASSFSSSSFVCVSILIFISFSLCEYSSARVLILVRFCSV